MNKLNAKIIGVDAITPSIKHFTLELTEKGFSYLPGQWIDLFVDIEGKASVGGYSIVSAPQTENTQIELVIKSSEHHKVTQFLHESASIGTSVQISQAQGSCVYQSDMGKKVVLIAGGIGITPLMSIFRTIRDQEVDTHVAMIYSAGAPESFVFSDEIRASAEQHENVLAVFTCTDLDAKLPDWIHFQERVDSFFLKTMSLPEEAIYYLCGPSVMLREVEESLLALGVAADHIKYEKW